MASTQDIEKATAEAVRIACELYKSITNDGELPRFNGSTFVVPANAAAHEVMAQCMKGVPDGLTGIERATIMSTAVHTAELHYSQLAKPDA